MNVLKDWGKSRKWGTLLFCVFCFAAIFNLDVSPFKYIVPSRPFSECLNNQLDLDTYVYLYGGNLINKGLMPYRDYFDHKGPLVYLMMAAGIRIGRIAGVWLLQTCLLAVTSIFAFKTSRLIASRGASALAAGLAILWYTQGKTGPETLSVPFLTITLFYFVRYLLDGDIKKGETFLTGCCFGIVALLKLNLTSLWMVFIPAVILTSLVKKEYLLLLCRAAVFLGGAIAVCAPVLFWLSAKSAFPDFIRDYWFYNLREYGGEPSFLDYLLFFIPMTGRVGISIWINHFWFDLPALLLYVLLSVCRPLPQKNLYIGMTAYLLISVLLIGMKGLFLCLEGCNSGCLYYYAFPLTAAYLPFFAVSFDFCLKLKSKRILAAAALFLLLSVPVFRTFCIPAAKDWIKIRRAAQALPAADLDRFGFPIRTDRAMLDLADWIRGNTEKDASVCGADPSLYWYADRLCASGNFFSRAQKSYEATFPRDENGQLPEYVFERRQKSLTFKQAVNPPPEERRKTETTAQIEKTLADDYHLVYQNECFDLYRLESRSGSYSESAEETEH